MGQGVVANDLNAYWRCDGCRCRPFLICWCRIGFIAVAFWRYPQHLKPPSAMIYYSGWDDSDCHADCGLFPTFGRGIVGTRIFRNSVRWKFSYSRKHIAKGMMPLPSGTLA